MKSSMRKSLLATALVAASLGGAVVAAAPAQAATTCVQNVYVYGGYAKCIGYIQVLLNEWARGYGISPLAVDNSFGPATKQRVKNFQEDAALTIDGVVGPKTWQVLCAYGKISHYSSVRAAAASAGC